jgi:hypothetical protein
VKLFQTCPCDSPFEYAKVLFSIYIQWLLVNVVGEQVRLVERKVLRLVLHGRNVHDWISSVVTLVTPLMDSNKLKALKVVDLRAILAKGGVQVPAKATKSDLIARIQASKPAQDAYLSLYPPQDDLLAPPEEYFLLSLTPYSSLYTFFLASIGM